MSRPRARRVLPALQRYLTFFALIAFLVTCCMTLFLNTMVRTMGLTLTDENISLAAKLTMANVLLLSLLCSLIDLARQKLTVDRPVRRIVRAAERVIQGDFSVRIPRSRADALSGFDTVIDYFNRMAAELGSTETLRTDFIANVSHELKTPLAVIQNYGTLLGQPALPEQERLLYAKTVTDASRRLAGLVTNILRLNKLENQKIFPTPAAFDLGEQLCECLLGFEAAWEEKGLQIETDLEDGVQICADAEMLSLVWNNLFSNAVKFTDEGGSIGLTLRTQGEFAVVTVSDTGCGISPEVGRHIFDKFYQGDPSHATQGNGLGLALVRRVMDLTGGEIAVESEPGRGSSFTVRLRRCPDETAASHRV